MISVSVGVISNFKAVKETPCPLCDSTNQFFLVLVLIYLVAGVLHPQEFHILLSGVIYFLALPTTFILLNIYSFANLNVMRWGTRESAQPKVEKPDDQKKTNTLCCLPNGGITIQIGDRGHSDYAPSIPRSSYPSHFHSSAVQRHDFSHRFSPNASSIDTSNPNSTLNTIPVEHLNQTIETLDIKYEKYSLGRYQNITKQTMSPTETKFYNWLIINHLKPLFEKEEKKAKITKDLLKLRNKFCLMFFSANIFWIGWEFRLCISLKC